MTSFKIFYGWHMSLTNHEMPEDLKESIGQLMFWGTVMAWVLVALVWFFPSQDTCPEVDHLRARIAKLEGH